MQVTVELDKRQTTGVLKNLERLEENSLDWQKTNVERARHELKQKIVRSATSKFDYYGTSQLNDKEGQRQLSESYTQTVRQRRNALGQFQSGYTLDVFYDAPHAIALEKGTGAYKIFPRGNYSLQFKVKNPADFREAYESGRSRIAMLAGNEITIAQGVHVDREPTRGYNFVRDGIIDFWREEAGSVKREFMEIALKSGFKIR